MSSGRIDMFEAKEPIEFTRGGYGAGHPWYYKLGGKVLSPKQIRQSVRHSGYQGSMRADIEAADDKSEPQRSNALRAIKTKVLDDLVADLSGYRAKRVN